MHPDMLLLAERLVLAMETMSHDVKNISAYVYDLSCSVSYLLNEKKKNKSISVVTYNEDDNPSSVTSEAGQEASAETEYSGQYEDAEDRSQSHFADLEHGESSFGDIASTSINPYENSDVLFSESKPIILKEIKSETQSEPEGENTAYGMHISHSTGKLTPSETVATIEFASNPAPGDIQSVASPNNFVLINDHTTFVSGLPEEQTLVARIHNMGSADDSSVVHTNVQSEERSYKCPVCGKSFNVLQCLKIHTRVHTGERPYKCNICGKAFTQSSHRTQHIRYCHTGEKPYKCSLCGKAFSEKSKLTLHTRCHTGERPFRCNICGKAFKQTSHLFNHSRTHMGYIP